MHDDLLDAPLNVPLLVLSRSLYTGWASTGICWRLPFTKPCVRGQTPTTSTELHGTSDASHIGGPRHHGIDIDDDGDVGVMVVRAPRWVVHGDDIAPRPSLFLIPGPDNTRS